MRLSFRSLRRNLTGVKASNFSPKISSCELSEVGFFAANIG